MNVAFATTDGKHVQGELRRAALVVVYDVSAEGYRFERASSFRDATHRSEHRIEAIHGSAMVYVALIGPSTAARLAARGIHPATALEGTSIEHILEVLVGTLAASSGGEAGHTDAADQAV